MRGRPCAVMVHMYLLSIHVCAGLRARVRIRISVPVAAHLRCARTSVRNGVRACVHVSLRVAVRACVCVRVCELRCWEARRVGEAAREDGEEAGGAAGGPGQASRRDPVVGPAVGGHSADAGGEGFRGCMYAYACDCARLGLQHPGAIGDTYSIGAAPGLI